MNPNPHTGAGGECVIRAVNGVCQAPEPFPYEWSHNPAAVVGVIACLLTLFYVLNDHLRQHNAEDGEETNG